MTDARQVPELPALLREPAPVIIVGMLAWLTATIVVWVSGTGGLTLSVCLWGLGVGVLGTLIVGSQLAAVRRGSKTAQEGLE
ncbi:hypothetical protein GOARA_056_01110 [Gordonia araii NBRC 100433]|uniref:DUF2530 domain-containing protein n=1 Tax=Gordonia araii NBRC 100433 TaxID=1073574 RepID=G7H3D8_9ACTN|nr:DUF2530 domain-containing protein [Gordonia araii]NNG96481.1 DUF2530 domain-containing protein [Gordonia araii NBRC 100433]GAB10363.1 hypothetical protein GOARA_056_01110 [Gordonia araii NBRC 100433]